MQLLSHARFEVSSESQLELDETSQLRGDLAESIQTLFMLLLALLSQALGLLKTSMGPYDGDDCRLQAWALGPGGKGLELLRRVRTTLDCRIDFTGYKGIAVIKATVPCNSRLTV